MNKVSYLYLFWPEFEDALEEELKIAGYSPEFLTCGLRIEGPALPPPVAFSRQLLIDPISMNGESIRSLGDKLGEILPDGLSNWQFHSYSIMERGGERRADLVSEALIELLKKKRRQTLRALDREGREGALLQHAVVSAEQSYISFVSAERRAESRDQICAFAGGKIEIEEDKRPPARAYRKLMEGLAVFGRGFEPQENVVDLGSSPGSWAWIALRDGANVIGVDRSEVDDSVAKHPKFSFRQGDAFSYLPDKRVDWLLCDVIADPQRSIKLLDEWLENKRTRFFCVTLKFKGDKRAEHIVAMRSVLKKHCGKWLLRHLENNGHEVTAIGERRE